MRKLMVAENKAGQAVMLDVELEKDPRGEDLRTSYIYQQRIATPKEILLYHAGFGFMLKF